MKGYKKLAKQKTKLDQLSAYYGIVTVYTPAQVRQVVKSRGIAVETVQEIVCLSNEQCRKYLYGGVVRAKNIIEFVRKINDRPVEKDQK